MYARLLQTSLLAFTACGSSATATPAPSTPAPAQAAATADTSPPAGSTADAAGSVAGLATMASAHDFVTTVSKAKAAIETRGLTLMAQVDHAANAKGVGMELRPTTLFIFGNPKAGSQLMATEQSAAIDLPMKLLVWQDESGETHVGYNDPVWIAQRHAITGKDALITKMQGALRGIASDAATN